MGQQNFPSGQQGVINIWAAGVAICTMARLDQYLDHVEGDHTARKVSRQSDHIYNH